MDPKPRYTKFALGDFSPAKKQGWDWAKMKVKHLTIRVEVGDGKCERCYDCSCPCGGHPCMLPKIPVFKNILAYLHQRLAKLRMLTFELHHVGTKKQVFLEKSLDKVERALTSWIDDTGLVLRGGCVRNSSQMALAIRVRRCENNICVPSDFQVCPREIDMNEKTNLTC